MFTLFQKHKHSIIKSTITIFVVLLMLSFGIDIFNTGAIRTRNHVATVNTTEISFNQLRANEEELYNFTKNMLRLQYGDIFEKIEDQLEAELRKNLSQRAIQDLISKILLLDFAKNNGILVPLELIKSQIKKDIEAIPQLGELNKQNFSAYLNMLRITERKLENKTKEQVLAKTFIKILGDAYIPLDKEIEELYQTENNLYSFSYVEFNSADYIKKIQIQEDELQKFFTKNQEAYLGPKSVTYSFVEFEPANFKNLVEVSTDDIQNEYEKQRLAFQAVPKYRLRQIVINKDEQNEEAQKKLALDIKARLNNGENFAKLAQKFSDDRATKNKGGDLGELNYGDIPELIKNKIFELKTGELSEIINSEKAYYIVLVEDVIQEKFQPLEQIKDQIITDLKTDTAPIYAKNAAANFVDNWRVRENREQTFKDFATSQKLNPQTKVANTKEGNDLLGEIALSMKQGALEVIEANGNFVVLLIDEIKEPRLPELKTIRANVEHDFRIEKSKELALENANQLLATLKEQKDLARVAKVKNLKVDQIASVSRSDNSVLLFQSPALKAAVFNLTLEQPISASVQRYGNSFYIFELNSLTPADTAKLAEQKKQIIEQERDKFQNTLLESLISNLKKHSKITINPDAFNDDAEI
ncbi:MAG: peptidyl-prolyl cis-trans isomerase [Deltaproteobacteria bacterium]|jgi:peptidyl-prolyl cis-trans isomerase D|nr:peptidyl-prolyl cis-trans isomerase [Deltaproteobacteria bacterium]